jgi:CHAD domain-containing protein
VAASGRRARALGLARRLAVGALQRLVKEVDRLSIVLEPVRAAIPLREPVVAGAMEVELTVRRAAVEPASPPSEAGVGVKEAVEAGAEVAVEVSPELAQVSHLRGIVEPAIARLRGAAAWDHAEDPGEVVHRLRVATRRLRAFVQLFAPVVGDKRARRLQQRLRVMTRNLGPVREWDVLLEGLRAEHAAAEPLARAALEHVMAWATNRRRKAARPAAAALAEVDAEGLAAALDAELDRVCGRMLRGSEPLSAQAAAWLEPERARAYEGMPRPQDDGDLDALHEVRIRAKRLRYAMELLLPSLPDTDKALRRGLKRVQSAIGRHRDAAQLGERLKERRAGLAAAGLNTLAGALEGVEVAVAHRKQRAFQVAVEALGGVLRG